jgi:redox-sensitive bicupin YhaK (pirin superfamily)
MTAGRGVIHSEMPEQEEGLMEGFQLWLNLPAKDKLMKPWYKDFKAAEIPSFTAPDGIAVRVIAGSSHGVAGAVQRDVTQPIYLDVELPAGATFAQALPAGHNAFLYPYRGAVTVAGKTVAERSMAILANEADADGVEVRADAPARFILIAGQPLNEPIAQYGPFVMNTQEEIHQAIQDFRAGLLGEEAHA